MAKISKTTAKERIEFLKRELEKHNYNYYVLNAPTITDFEFDLLMGELQGLEKRFPEFATEDSPSRHVGSDLTSGAAGSDFVQVAHRWPMLSLSTDAIYRTGERFALGFTADGFWNSNTERLKWADSVLYSEEENAASKGYSPFSFGVGLVQEIFYNNVALYVQEGIYLQRKMGIHGEHGWLYERAGIRYYPEALHPFFVSVCIKAHKFKADYMDFSVGIRF